MFRCAWHCMDLDNDGGVCNAILYDRETKVVRIKRGEKTIEFAMLSLMGKKVYCFQVCTMGEGRQVSAPTADTGLRVAWAR